jgi:hypothetical protein
LRGVGLVEVGVSSMPAHATRMGLHPAHTFSVAHHRDIATVVQLALNGIMDEQVVNVTDDAPVTVYEMAGFAGTPIEGSAEPLTHPWSGRVDGALARELGFQPSVPTISDAARRGIL